MNKFLFLLVLIVATFACKQDERQPLTGGSLYMGDDTLTQVQLFTPDLKVSTTSGELVFDEGKHYRSDSSAVSVFGDEMLGSVKGKFLSSDRKGGFVAIKELDTTDMQMYGCFTEEVNVPDSFKVKPIVKSNKVVTMYIEIAYDVVQKKGGVDQAIQYVTALFNVSQGIYQKAGVNIKINEIYVWDKQDPYVDDDTGKALTAFQAKNTSAVCHLVSMPDKILGGIAYVNALCANGYNKAYSQIAQTFSTNSYSWSVECFTHETGHAIASPHTHSCSWPGGPLDNCYTPEGSCSPGPAPVNGGTVMSYCHLTNYGINFSKGFHPVVQNLLLQRIEAASCLPVDTVVNPPNPPSNPTYCVSKGNSGYEWVTGVSFGNTERKSAADGGYFGVGSLIGSGEMTVTIGSKSAYKEAIGVFVDWNKNGTFDTNENVATLNPSTARTLKFPLSGSPGTYRMRVVVQYNKVPTACMTSFYGETEDYDVTIEEVSSCPTPTVNFTSPASGSKGYPNIVVQGSSDVISIDLYFNGSLIKSGVGSTLNYTVPDNVKYINDVWKATAKNECGNEASTQRTGTIVWN